MTDPQQELRIATFRRSAAALMWSALVLIAVSGATGYLLTNLPDPFEDWMLLAAAGLIVLFAVIVPWWRWASRSYLVTTRRVIATRGVVIRRRSELMHATGYGVELIRGPMQGMFGTGTLRLSSGESVLELRSIHNPKLVRETLSDQIEICQILAHRAAQQEAADPYLDRDLG
ncbi:PH domain-containing protein [Microbacterium karelineae]|uniref:PH domain-containing protein n=1 Tax=Microbacterium karelineae TaxID=2654283 RepID=UPI0012EA51A0|nr:PH domain-containing protein [Microbacterium karelineae]